MEESPETQLVMITIKEGYLEYDEPYLQVHPGDTIKWSCAHPFVVRFDVDSPMEKEWQRGGSGIYATDVIRREAPYGRYKYFVAVWDGSQILTDDPELIVRRRTPDPGREKS